MLGGNIDRSSSRKSPPKLTFGRKTSMTEAMDKNSNPVVRSLPSKGFVAKRRSAVELLEASKPFYVKSEAVLDTKQELKNSQHLYIKADVQPSFGLLLNKSSSFRTPGSTSLSMASSSTATASTVTSATKTSSPVPQRQNARFVHNPNFRYIARGETSQPAQKPPPPLPPKSPVCARVTNVVSSSPPPPPLPPKKPSHLSTPPPPPPRPHKSFSVESKLRELIGAFERLDAGEKIESKPPAPTPPPRKSARRVSGGSGLTTSVTSVAHGAHRSPATSDYISGSPSFCLDQMSIEVDDEAGKENANNNLNQSSSAASSQSECDRFFGNQKQPIDGEEGAEEETKKTQLIARSKSDISHRYTKGPQAPSLFPPPPPPPPPLPPPPPAPRALTPAEADRFFDQLGLQPVALIPSSCVTPPSDKSSPVFFDTVSTTDGSASRTSDLGPPLPPCATGAAVPGVGICPEELAFRHKYLAAATAAAYHPAAVGHLGYPECSIVEKNARIIKWLFQCRRAQQQWLLQHQSSFR